METEPIVPEQPAVDPQIQRWLAYEAIASAYLRRDEQLLAQACEQLEAANNVELQALSKLN